MQKRDKASKDIVSGCGYGVSVFFDERDLCSL